MFSRPCPVVRNWCVILYLACFPVADGVAAVSRSQLRIHIRTQDDTALSLQQDRVLSSHASDVEYQHGNIEELEELEKDSE
ncbi:hypothetical protein DEU56DRAFT_798079 [Suillus clintonianus]|uniref:uncharacterized protein n=1 Tax=Suillus clintonianus TaxID=1904413 RepID=UPI001B879816|nr:uncharacterized protein DEU56DRAFT_798079 [Suillus clintonianus]KAG2140666.1 hypothetical protein DEU56DRAFT_798079 [Suillus clintonianus]